MKLLKIIVVLVAIVLLNSCASSYKSISPEQLDYNSTEINEGVALEYKYNLLNKKYSRKETKKGVKLVAVKLTNSTEKELIFGQNLKLVDSKGNELSILSEEVVFKALKQHPATHLFYLLLSPLQLYSGSSSGQGSGTPIGLVVAPVITGTNVIVSSKANKKFKKDLLSYNIIGNTIKKGETVYGLIGIKADDYDAIKMIIE
ncbi:MAG: hypothetical protein COA88_07225 [Kordia sp.]|nr:MAG: hypothetical protein COA88_07225 [Kordia sp.]